MSAIYITDHAVARYQERVGSELPVDTLRDWLVEILTPAALIGARRYAIGGFTFCFRRTGPHCAVTTVLEGSMPCAIKAHRCPRSDWSRREVKRCMRRNVKRAGR